MDGEITHAWEAGGVRLIKLEHLIQFKRDCWGFCLKCGHAERIKTRKLIIKAGWVAISTAQAMLRCIRCGSRGKSLLIPELQPWPER